MRFAVAILLASCWTRSDQPAVTQPTVPSTQTPPDLIVILERTGCFGACPAYTVAVGNAGFVLWDGEANVATVGSHGRQVSRQQVEELRRAIDAAQFFDLDESGQRRHACTQGGSATCPGSVISCIDTPHAIVTVIRGDEKHIVDDAHCTSEPSALTRLEDLIDRVCGTDAWIGSGAPP
jgi:hypothetical protein